MTAGNPSEDMPDRVKNAALWFARNHATRSGAFIPYLRETFNLTSLEAIRAMQLGRKMVRDQRHG